MACNFCTLQVTGGSAPSTFTFTDCNLNTITIPLAVGDTYILNTDNVPSTPIDCTLSCTTESIISADVLDCCGQIAGKMSYGSVLNPPNVVNAYSIYFSDGTIYQKDSPFCISGSLSTTPSYPDISAISLGTYLSNDCGECVAIHPCDTDYYLSCCDDCQTYITPPKECFFGVLSGGIGVPGVYSVDILNTFSGVCYSYISDPINSGFNMYDIEIYSSETVNIAYFYENCSDCLNTFPCPITPSPTPTPTITPTPSITPTPEPTPKFVDFVNECDVVTIFPMSVNCSVVNPSPEGVDGIVSLIISGGTPPYTIQWNNGNISPILYNLPAGSYGATVIDYYGDFTASTVCVLTGSTPTPSPTPTPTPTTPYIEYTLCMTLRLLIKGKYQTNSATFIPDGLFNSRPSWINGANTIKIVWDVLSSPNRWVLSSTTATTFTVFNTNPAYPPTSGGWTVVGATGEVTVSEGECENAPLTSFLKTVVPQNNEPLTISISQNNNICGCDGSISIITQGGTPPFLYSVNSGLSYQKFPVFNNLCSGIYTIKVIDDTGLEVITTNTLPPPESPKTYNVSLLTTNKTTSVGSLSKTVEYTTSINIFPELPDGAIIVFTLNHTSISKSSPSMSSSTSNISSILEIDSVVVSPDDVVSGTSTSINTLPGCQSDNVYLNTNTKTWYNIQYSNQTDFNLNTNEVVSKNEDNDCYIGTNENIFQISNVSINGCYCCTVITS